MRALTVVFVAFWVAVAVLAFRVRRPAEQVSAQPMICCGDGLPNPGLRWLARHQSRDGRWSATRFGEQCGETVCSGTNPGEDDVSSTALATLAFLGQGYTPQNRASYVDPHTHETMRFGSCVRSAMKFLIARQQARPEGPLLERDARAALALCEAYGITNAVAYRAPAAQSIARIERSIAAGQLDDDLLGECALAIKSATISEIAVSSETLAAIVSWSRTAPPSAHRCLARRMFDAGRGCDEDVKLLLADPPRWEKRDFDGWPLSTLAVFQSGGPEWKRWRCGLADELGKHQEPRSAGCAEGSWDGPCGRVHATAQALLTLEIYDRYPCVFGER